MIHLVFTVVDVIGTILAYLNCGSAQQSSFIVPTDRTSKIRAHVLLNSLNE